MYVRMWVFIYSFIFYLLIIRSMIKLVLISMYYRWLAW